MWHELHGGYKHACVDLREAGMITYSGEKIGAVSREFQAIKQHSSLCIPTPCGSKT